VPRSARLSSAVDQQANPMPLQFRLWHVRDVMPAATGAAAIKGAADIPARSPFMLRPRCRTLKALSCRDPLTINCGPSLAAPSISKNLPTMRPAPARRCLPSARKRRSRRRSGSLTVWRVLFHRTGRPRRGHRPRPILEPPALQNSRISHTTIPRAEAYQTCHIPGLRMGSPVLAPFADKGRYGSPFGDAYYFMMYNANKRSLTVNLKKVRPAAAPGPSLKPARYRLRRRAG
jgi:hypothetical protein